MNVEQVFTRPRSQTFSRYAGFHAKSKRIWWIDSFIPARSGWSFSMWFPLHELQDRSRAFTYARILGLLIIC